MPIAKQSVQINAHKLVASVAIGMTEIDYDKNASDNTFYKLNPDRAKWVRQMCGLHIDDARDLLYATAQDDNTTQEEKIRIYEALTLDEQIPKSERRTTIAIRDALRDEFKKSEAYNT